jgi:UPF0288 family protein (methanogenesis marker protein 3)
MTKETLIYKVTSIVNGITMMNVYIRTRVRRMNLSHCLIGNVIEPSDLILLKVSCVAVICHIDSY